MPWKDTHGGGNGGKLYLSQELMKMSDKAGKWRIKLRMSSSPASICSAIATSGFIGSSRFEIASMPGRRSWSSCAARSGCRINAAVGFQAPENMGGRMLLIKLARAKLDPVIGPGKSCVA